MSESVSLMVSRQMISEVAQKLIQLKNDVAKQVALHLLSVIQPRVISYEEQVRFTSLNLFLNKNIHLTDILSYFCFVIVKVDF